jgi:hypothetical protein
MPGVPDLGEFIFRAHPSFELIVFDRLEAGERSALASLAGDPDFYGVLRPGAPGLSLKSVNRNVALLFSTMSSPGRIPSYVKTELGPGYERFVAELVLDQIIQVEQQGTFLSGPAAKHLFLPADSHHEPTSRISALSQDAVKHAQYLQIDDPSMLAARIYFFNREPASPSRVSAFPSETEVARYLGIAKGGQHADRLRRNWKAAPADPMSAGWIIWQNRRKSKPKGRSGFGFKLYVSPPFEAMPEAFSAALNAFTETGVQRFKAGRDIYGLLRPDKLVAYFSSREHLDETASHLFTRLAGMPAHGVPFTCDLHGDGLLSWGMDPPRGTQVLPWQERQSWRLWVANKLAAALVSAKAQSPPPTEPWKFAVERVRFEGIETNSWTPSPDIFARDNES